MSCSFSPPKVENGAISVFMNKWNISVCPAPPVSFLSFAPTTERTDLGTSFLTN